MMRNLVTRGCPLYSLEAYPDLQSQKARSVLPLNPTLKPNPHAARGRRHACAHL